MKSSTELIVCKNCNTLLTQNIQSSPIKINGVFFNLNNTNTGSNMKANVINKDSVRSRVSWVRIKDETQEIVINGIYKQIAESENEGHHKDKPIFREVKRGQDSILFPLKFWKILHTQIEESYLDDFDCLFQKLGCYSCEKNIGKCYLTGKGFIVDLVGVILLDFLRVEFIEISNEIKIKVESIPGDSRVEMIKEEAVIGDTEIDLPICNDKGIEVLGNEFYTERSRAWFIYYMFKKILLVK